MRKPRTLTYLFGNPITVLAAIGATAFLGYRAWNGELAALPAVIAFLVACQSMRSTDQLQKYNEWKREWEAMEGKLPNARGPRFALTPAIRFAIAIAAWCVGAYGMFTVPLGDDLMAKLAMASFWLGSLLMVGVLIYRALPKRTRATTVAKSPDPIVSVCLAPPKSSPSIPDAFRQLPTYCLTVIAGSPPKAP